MAGRAKPNPKKGKRSEKRASSSGGEVSSVPRKPEAVVWSWVVYFIAAEAKWGYHAYEKLCMSKKQLDQVWTSAFRMETDVILMQKKSMEVRFFAKGEKGKLTLFK
jgi:hypothetical protein